MVCGLGCVLLCGGVQGEGRASQPWLCGLGHVTELPGLRFLICEMGIIMRPHPLAIGKLQKVSVQYLARSRTMQRDRYNGSLLRARAVASASAFGGPCWAVAL